MKQLLIGVCLLIGLTVSAQDKVVINDENAQVRNHTGFKGIKVSHAIDLYLSQSDDEKVVVSAKYTSDRERIKSKVENGILKIWYDNDGMNWNTSDKKLRAYVSFRTLEQLEASGACDVFVNGVIRGDELEIELSGASDFKGAVDIKDLRIDQSGSSDATIKGIAGKCKVDVSGASDFKGYELVVDYCEAEASGASDINITVNKEINAEASGASSVNIKGSGVISKMNSSGSSSIRKT